MSGASSQKGRCWDRAGAFDRLIWRVLGQREGDHLRGRYESSAAADLRLCAPPFIHNRRQLRVGQAQVMLGRALCLLFGALRVFGRRARDPAGHA